MALTATVHRLQIALSDVDRNTYETLDLRVARHPSESARYLFTRTLAYCLSYEPGIAFSKGGVSSTDEPPVSVRDERGGYRAWIDVGSPSADRLHKASKASQKVELYTHVDLALLVREAASRPIHRIEAIAVWRVEPTLLDRLETRLDRSMQLEIVRNEGMLYVTVAGEVIESSMARAGLVG